MRDKLLGDKHEVAKRREILDHLVETTRASSKSNDCRGLGDLAIAHLAPSDATLLTTNTSDFAPLAAALGLSLRNPLVQA